MEHFDLVAEPEITARYNIAPGQMAAVVREQEDGRALAFLKWGLIPPWAKDPKSGPHPINARAETAHEKPLFRNALVSRRCLVAADGFYEWKKTNGKQPYFCRLKGGGPFGMAALWEKWQAPGGEEIQSFTILTTNANDLMADVHDRMPVIVDPADFDLWMDPKAKDHWAIDNVLKPYSPDRMEIYPVSPMVNNPSNEDAGCINPVAT